MKLFMVTRILHVATGQQSWWPIAIFEDRAMANSYKAEVDAKLTLLSQCELSEPHVDGRKRNLGITVKNVLSELGISALGHGIVEVDTMSRIEVPSGPKVVLQ